VSILPHYLAASDCLAADRQGQEDTRLTLTPSFISNSNYVIMISNWNCVNYIFVFLYCNHQAHRDVLSPCVAVSDLYGCETGTFILRPTAHIAEVWQQIGKRYDWTLQKSTKKTEWNSTIRSLMILIILLFRNMSRARLWPQYVPQVNSSVRKY
jgi:hypothetical protein